MNVRDNLKSCVFVEISSINHYQILIEIIEIYIIKVDMLLKMKSFIFIKG
jgi:hypothetical protein